VDHIILLPAFADFIDRHALIGKIIAVC